MAPVLGLLAARDVALSLQASFAATYLVTDGGPDRATLFLPIYVYDVGFEQLRYGYAAAMTTAMYLITAAILLRGLAAAARRPPGRGPLVVLAVVLVERLAGELVALAVVEGDLEVVLAVGVGGQQREALLVERALVDGEPCELGGDDGAARRSAGGPRRASSPPILPCSPRQPPMTSSVRSIRQSGLSSAVTSVKSAQP